VFWLYKCNYNEEQKGPQRCTASIVAVYWQSSESLIEGHPPQKGPALESKGIYSAGSSLPSSRSMLIIKCIFWFLKSIHL
ncbi:hypothetical protein Anas_06623, partial [Armadillidium nasatum]